MVRLSRPASSLMPSASQWPVSADLWTAKLLEPGKNVALQSIALGLQVAERRTDEEADGGGRHSDY